VGVAVREPPAEPVAHRQRHQDDADRVRPDDRRGAEVGGEQPHGGDLGAQRPRPHHEDEERKRRPYGPVYGAAKHGLPPHTSTTAPPTFRNSDFCTRALGVARGLSCGSSPERLGVLVGGGASVPWVSVPTIRVGPVSHITI